MEIKVSPGKAFFETKASWFNNTELPCTYYHWMNAASKAGDDLEFIYPGKNWIGHGEETAIGLRITIEILTGTKTIISEAINRIMS